MDSHREITGFVRENYIEGDYQGDGDDDLSAVQWKSPSDMNAEEVMGDIELFNRAMADNSQVVVDEGGEWL